MENIAFTASFKTTLKRTASKESGTKNRAKTNRAMLIGPEFM
jgi:hypothetical protein